MRNARSWIVGSLLALPAVASAAPSVTGPQPEAAVPPTLGWIGERLGGQAPRTLMQVIPSVGVTHAVGQTTIVYMNRRGATLTPGNNDSRTNRSTIVQQTSQIPAFEGTDAEWTKIMTCVREIFAPFDINVTDVDPGNVPHFESIMGGRAQQAGMEQGVLGVSPFTVDCQVIPNAIVYTFTQSTRDAYGTTAGLPEEICEIAAQEIAHAFGLDHEYLASDPMTYLNFNGLKKFQNTAAQCGEYAARTCGLPGTGVVCSQTQNSVQLLTQRIGLGDAIAPTVAITSPQNNATVPLSFSVSANASDNNAVSKVEVYVDGQLKDTKTAAPFTFALANLAAGGHAIEVKAYDSKNVASSTVQVTARAGAPEPTPTPDPGTDPGNGNGNDTDGDGTSDNITGGCSTGGASSGGALLALGLGALVAGRRRRR